MIDLHTHILPGMDDGSPDVETSVAMLLHQAQQGVDTLCATSHYYRWENSVEKFCARRMQAMEELFGVMPDGLPRILPAAEVAFFTGISECPELDKLCIEDTRTLMLEMPFTDWNDFQIEEVSTLVLDREYDVVLVHPERFCISKSNRQKLRQLAELPIGFQVNAGTLLNWKNRRLGLELLQQSKVPLLASDCHNLGHRPPNLNEGRAVVAQKLGRDFLGRIDEHAERLIGLFEVRISE